MTLVTLASELIAKGSHNSFNFLVENERIQEPYYSSDFWKI